MKQPITLILRLAGLVWLASACIGMAMAQSPASVGVYAEHRGGKLVYHYRVTNTGQDNIAAVRIGYDTKNDNDNYNDTWELLELPTGWDFYKGIPPTSATSPFGWRVYVITLEESELLGINWRVIDNNSPRLYPSQTFTEMSVTLDKADANYITGHAFIRFPEKRQKPNSLTVPLERLDITPPTLSVTLSPNTLWPPNEKLIPITATITATDDYDTEPEIKLESITANEKLEAEDIRDAAMGTDDRQFRQCAERRGERDNRDGRERDDRRNDKDTAAAPTGRIYTITYSATDASGNKTMASATVTVPHDQRKNDRDEKDKGGDKDKWEW